MPDNPPDKTPTDGRDPRPCAFCGARRGFQPHRTKTWVCARCDRVTNPGDAAYAKACDAFWTEAEFDELTWFETVGIHQVPDEPFDLTSFIHVKDPALWRQRILDDIASGPTGPRSRYGGLFNVIQYLRACIQGREQR